MQVSATEFRKHLFKLLERAVQGEPVDLVYKGTSLQVAARGAHSKLERAKRQHALACDPDEIVHTDKKLMTQWEAKWRKERSRL